jgi:archaellum component FlaC
MISKSKELYLFDKIHSKIEELKDQVLNLKKVYKPIFKKDYSNVSETWYYDLNSFYK